MKITYCKSCLLPSTKPHLSFNEDGVCSACIAHKTKNSLELGIDWVERRDAFEKIIEIAKKKSAPFYDALVPVSGGKDSIAQVSRLLNRGLRILAVNIDYGIKTEIGIYNLSLIPKMGANLMVFTPSQPLHRHLVRLGFESYGDPDLMSHCMLHAHPLRIAIELKIPLVLLGENSAFEYSGKEGEIGSQSMTREWFEKFAANMGITPFLIAEKYKIPYAQLLQYDYPKNLESSDTKAVFCSHYFHWDSEENLKIAQNYGFKSLANASEGTYRNYVGIDEKINRIHQYMKVLKFGYGRATDHACEDIRNGRITRKKGIELVKAHDRLPLTDYYIDDFIEFIGINKDEFFNILESYRNPKIWEFNAATREFAVRDENLK